MNPHLLVLGTHNRKKGEELQGLLAPYGLTLKTLADYPEAIEVVEDGQSFADNAQLKASQQAQHLQQWVLGEDSGIVVDALQGAPGIYSARFAGPQATDQQNNELLLEKLDGLPPAKRTAHYVCHAALANPQGTICTQIERTCQGVIRSEPSGAGGFGYDPLFEIAEYHRTFGEMGPAIKRAISHRGRALRQIAPMIAKLILAAS